MRRGRRRADEGLDSAEARGAMGIPELRERALHGGPTALEGEAEHAAETLHLRSRDRMRGVTLESGVADRFDCGMGLEETRDGERARVLLADPDGQCLESPQQEVRREGRERRAGDLAVVIDLLDQR